MVNCYECRHHKAKRHYGIYCWSMDVYVRKCEAKNFRCDRFVPVQEGKDKMRTQKQLQDDVEALREAVRSGGKVEGRCDLDWFIDWFEGNCPGCVPHPGIFLVGDQLRLEWNSEERELSLDVNVESHMAYWCSAEIDAANGNKNHDRQIDMDDPDDVAWVMERITFDRGREKETKIRYRKRPTVVDSEQWFKVAYDREAGVNTLPIYHLDVGYYRNPDVDGRTVCQDCGCVMHAHGWIDDGSDGHTVCPGNWVVTELGGAKRSYDREMFTLIHEPDMEYSTSALREDFEDHAVALIENGNSEMKFKPMDGDEEIIRPTICGAFEQEEA